MLGFPILIRHVGLFKGYHVTESAYFQIHSFHFYFDNVNNVYNVIGKDDLANCYSSPDRSGKEVVLDWCMLMITWMIE